MAEFMTVTDAAKRLGVNRRTIWRLISQGRLDTVPNPIDRREKLLRREAVEDLRRYTDG